MTENELSRLKGIAVAETRANNEKITSYLKSFTSRPINICISGSGKGRDINITVRFKDDNDKEIFGANFDMTYTKQYDWDSGKYSAPELAMDCGSCGISTRKENPGRPFMFKMMGDIWAHEEEFTKLLDSLPHEANIQAEKAEDEWDEEQDAIKAAKEKAIEDEAKAKLVPGFTYEEVVDGRNYSYEVTKVTPKRVYVKYTVSRNSREYEGCSYNYYEGIETTIKTGYVKYSLFLYLITHKDNNEHTAIANCIRGINQIGRSFTRTSNLSNKKGVDFPTSF